MKKGQDLTSKKQGKIASHSLAGWSVKKIVHSAGRSRKAIINYLENVSGYGNKRNGNGRPTKSTLRDRLAILREATQSGSSSQKMIEKLDSRVNASTVCTVFSRRGRFRHDKAQQTSALTDEKKKFRIKGLALK